MDISTNRISLTFDDAERMEKKNVSVQDAKDGGISQIQVGATMDCSVQEAGKHHIVYTEAEAKQLQKQNMVPLDDAQMSPADFISRCMTGKDAKAVSEDGTPLEEYTSSQLERAVTRIKAKQLYDLCRLSKFGKIRKRQNLDVLNLGNALVHILVQENREDCLCFGRILAEEVFLFHVVCSLFSRSFNKNYKGLIL